MKNQKITRAYITHFNQISMEQLLPSGRKVCVEWTRIDKNGWLPIYSTDSVYHICPYNGRFGACLVCKAYNDDAKTMADNCWKEWQKELISNEEMTSRAIACADAPGCTISFRSVDV